MPEDSDDSHLAGCGSSWTPENAATAEALYMEQLRNAAPRLTPHVTQIVIGGFRYAI